MGELDIRLKNIESCMSKGDYESAVTIASKIKEPRKIKNVDQILMLAELYHKVKEVPDHDEISSELYDLAYSKAPNSKNVVLAAFDFNVKRKDPINALRYFDLFRRLETDEAEICIARHKYYVAIGAVSDEEMIENLERLKEIRHIEQWEYALARLYKKAGYVEKCISECDEIFAWFHKGKYVTKALELKMEFEPLSKTQQYQYDMRFIINDEEDLVQGAKANMEQMAPKEEKNKVDDFDEIQVSELGQTGDLQDMIKKNLSELYGDDDMNDDTSAIGRTGDLYKNILHKDTSEIERMNEEYENNVMIGRTGGFDTDSFGSAENLGSTRVFPAVGSRVNPPRKQQLEPREEVYHGTIPFDASEVIMEDESAKGKTSELIMSLREDEDDSRLNDFKKEFKKSAGLKAETLDDDLDAEFDLDKFPSAEEIAKSQKLAKIKDLEETQSLVSSMAVEEPAESVPAPESYRNAYGEVGNYIYQNEDGQLSLSHITAEEIVEKQITGQMNIKEFLDNWNNAKDEKETERQERFKARMLEETGSLMSTIDMTVPIMDTELDERLLTKSGSDEAVEEFRKVINPDIISSKEELDEIMAKEEKAETETPSDVEADETEKISEEEKEVLDEGFEEAIPETAAEVIAEEIIEETADLEAEEETGAAEDAAEAVPEEVSVALEDELDSIIADAIEAEEEIEEEVSEEALDKAEDSAGELESEEEAAAEEIPEAVSEAKEETKAESTSEAGSIWEEVEGRKKPEAKAEESEAKSEETEESDESDEAEETEETGEQVSSQGTLSDDERKLFAPFLYSKAMKKQIIDSLERLTLAAYVGNLLITADESKDASDLARLFALYAKESDSNFTGNVAIIDSEKFNNKDIKSIFSKLTNGALIIERANKLTSASINTFLKELNQEEAGIIAVLTDTKTEMRFLLDRAPILTQFFDGRVDIISKTTKMLVKYGIQYAQSKGYVIDSMAELAFNKRIDDLKKGNHNVTIGEVKEIVDEAVRRATKGLFKFSKKDENGNIILREKDFN